MAPSSIAPLPPATMHDPELAERRALEQGIVGATLNPYSQKIVVRPHDGAARCISITQSGGGHEEEICVNEVQLQWFLLAIAAAAKQLGYEDYE